MNFLGLASKFHWNTFHFEHNVSIGCTFFESIQTNLDQRCRYIYHSIFVALKLEFIIIDSALKHINQINFTTYHIFFACSSILLCTVKLHTSEPKNDKNQNSDVCNDNPQGIYTKLLYIYMQMFFSSYMIYQI